MKTFSELLWVKLKKTPSTRESHSTSDILNTSPVLNPRKCCEEKHHKTKHNYRARNLKTCTCFCGVFPMERKNFLQFNRLPLISVLNAPLEGLVEIFRCFSLPSYFNFYLEFFTHSCENARNCGNVK